MSQLSCLCGHVINLTASPNEQESYLISDAVFERVADEFDGPCSDTNVILDSFANTASRVVECPECRRLYISRGLQGRNLQYRVYTFEQDM